MNGEDKKLEKKKDLLPAPLQPVPIERVDLPGIPSSTEQQKEVKQQVIDSPSHSSGNSSDQESDNSSSDQEDIMSGSSTKFQPLTKENYSSWSVWIESSLSERNLWFKLDGSDASTTDYEANIRKAYHHIVLRCDAEHATLAKSIGEYDSVKTLVEFKKKYEGSGTMAKMQILLESLQTRHQEGPVDDHIDKIRKAWQLLIQKGGISMELMQVTNLMISVSSDLSQVMAAFSLTKDEDLKFEDVAAAILGEQRRQAITAVQGKVDTTALAARQRSKYHKDKGVTCTYCNKQGHPESDCYRKHGKPQKKPPADTAHFALSARLYTDNGKPRTSVFERLGYKRKSSHSSSSKVSKSSSSSTSDISSSRRFSSEESLELNANEMDLAKLSL